MLVLGQGLLYESPLNDNPGFQLTPASGKSYSSERRKEVAMKKLLTAFFVLVLASAASAQVFFTGTFDQALAKAKTENKKVLVDFYSYT